MKQYSRFKKWVETRKIQKRLDKFMVLWVVLIVIISIGLLNTDLSSVLGISTKKEVPLVVFPTPTIQELSPTPTYTQPTLAPKVYVSTPTPDPDPPVLCNVSPNCGGGTTPLRQNECSNSTCCQIGNKWIFYKDKNQCTQDQNTESINARRPNYVPSQITTVPYVPTQYYSCTLYYPSLKTYSTYNYLYETKEDCDGAQQSLNQSGANSNSGQTQQPTTVPDNSYNQQQNGQCKMYANQWYANQGTQCSGSCAEAAKQIAYPEYQAKLADCDKIYPIK